MNTEPKPVGEWTAGHDGTGEFGIYHGNETKKGWSGKGRLLVDGLQESQAKAIAKAHNASLSAVCKRHQPKPTGEWTRDGTLIWCDGKIVPDIVTAHNASLADEERRANDSINENVRLMNELPAEREKVQAYEGALIKIANDPNCDRCQVAVDALAKAGK